MIVNALFLARTITMRKTYESPLLCLG